MEEDGIRVSDEPVMGMMGGAIDPAQYMCGGKHEGRLDGYKDEIESKDLTIFEYYNTKFHMHCELKDDRLYLSSTGGYSTNRDGKYFIVRFDTDDLDLLPKLQDIIDKYQLYKNNGYTCHVDGIPECGDYFSAEYKSGEKIYHVSNQFPTVGGEAQQDIFNTFHRFVHKHGFDFTSEGSNVQLYDDADVDYVQGTWTGKHFGREIVATFDKDHVTITVDGKETDNCKYTIYEGHVITDKLIDPNKEVTDYHDYEYFNGVSIFSKKNYFTMTAYFMGDSYSTCDMHNFDKEKPKEE